MITVVVADDHAVVREGLSLLVASEADLEGHFRHHYFEAEFRTTHEADLPGQISGDMLSPSLLASLRRYRADDGRKVDGWMREQRCTVVVFDDGPAFRGANTRDELRSLS